MSDFSNEILQAIDKHMKPLEKELEDLHKWRIDQEKKLSAMKKQIESIHEHNYEQDERLDQHGNALFELGDGGSDLVKARKIERKMKE